MSLIQSALDRAEQPDPDPVQNQPGHLPAAAKSAPVVIPMAQPMAPADLAASVETHGEPRLNAMRFYETENQKVEEAIQESLRKETSVIEKKEEADQASRKSFLGLIAALLFLSLIASRFLIPSSKPESSHLNLTIPAAVPAAEKPEPVIVKKETMNSAKRMTQVKFLLTGITAAEDTPLAVINNQVVGVGDHLREGATVKAITEKRVVLDIDGKQIVLNF